MSPDQPAWGPRQRATPFSERPNNSERIWQGFRKKMAPEPSRPPTPRAILQKLYGKGPRGGLNTRQAAQDLGVSQRSVQRWVKERKMPKSDAGERLRQNYRSWQNNTAKGRSSVLGRKKRDELLNAPRFTFTGHLKISSDVRKRDHMQVDISPEARGAWGSMVDHLAAGNDQEAHEALEAVISESGDWGADVYVKIDDLDF